MFRRRDRKSPPKAYMIRDAVSAAPAPEAVTLRAESARTRRASRARARVLMCAAAFAFIFTGLAIRLATVSFGDYEPRGGEAAARLADAPRPEIVDRNGALLAVDLPTTALEIAGREVWDAGEAARAVADVLPDIDASWLEQRLAEGRYVELPVDLTPAQRQAAFDLGVPGLRFAARTRRVYPQGDLAAHIVGHGEKGRGGVMGLERVASAWAGDGPLAASIDIRVQKLLEDELAAAQEEFSAIAAWGAVMDVATGEVIALASLPDFDPNKPGAAPADHRRNRAVYDLYELGSAFKAFTAAAALDEGVAKEGTLYDARGSFKVADRRITDYHGENRILTFSEVIQHSSNIGAARIAGDLGPDNQRAYLKKLGLLDALPIELRENRSPQPPRKWGPVENATVSYGHGISVTPLHLISAFCAVVNGGVYRAPTFTKVAGGRPGEDVFSAETSAVMRRILRRVVTDGTAGNAETEGYYPIGKTATADKPSASGGYRRNSRIASFIGAVPGHDPRYAILISLDEPKPTAETFGYATAGWVAAPAFSRFVENAAPFLGLASVNEATAISAFATGGGVLDARAAEAPETDAASPVGAPTGAGP